MTLTIIMKKCSFSGVKSGECHQVVHTTRVGLRLVTEEENRLLCVRTNTDRESIVNICYHHDKVLLKKFSFLEKICCDPFNIHCGRTRRKGLQIVPAEFYEKVKHSAPRAVPWKKYAQIAANTESVCQDHQHQILH